MSFWRRESFSEVARLRQENARLQARVGRARIEMARTAAAHIKTLQDEVAWLRSQFWHERQRAEVGVDQLLQVRANVGPITHPTPEEARDMQSAADRLLTDTEFMTAGQV